jgi:hypothetical protein
MIFRGSDAIRDGRFTPNQLRGPLVTRLFRDVYADAAVQVTHEVRCRAATLILPPDAVVTGRSAATVRGVALARAADPVEVIVPFERKVSHRAGVDVRRNDIGPDEWRRWQQGRLASPLRTALDLALDRPLPIAVGDLDAVLRRNLVALDELTDLVNLRSDRGIQNARRAVELVDPRAESRPESQVRVHLVLAGLRPVPQYWIEDAGGRIARVDLAFPREEGRRRVRRPVA